MEKLATIRMGKDAAECARAAVLKFGNAGLADKMSIAMQSAFVTIELTELECEFVRRALIKTGDISHANHVTKCANKVFVTRAMIEREERAIKRDLKRAHRQVGVPVGTVGILDDDMSFQRAVDVYERDAE